MRSSKLWLAALAGLFSSACEPPDSEPIKEKIDEVAPPALSRADRARDLSLQAAQDRSIPGVASGDLVSVRSVSIDALGTTHTRIAQTFQGVPVFGGELIVHLDEDGTVRGFTDGLVKNVQADINASLGPADAEDIAVRSGRGLKRRDAEGSAELVILRLDGRDLLAYRLKLEDLTSPTPSMPVVFVDARSGRVLWSYDNLQTARDRRVHNLNHGTSLPGPLARSEGGSPSGDTDVDTNYERLGSTYDCYSALFNRDSFDDAGATLISSVHYSNNYVNAFWNGTQMVYGDGDNVNSRSLALSMDVTAHELTHAVTEYTSNLIYSGEPGGLNEAMSDIFGNVCEWYRDNNGNISGPTSANTWMVGEDIWLADPALRYMNDPVADGVSLDFWTSTAGNEDVHFSSGIANLAFYLLSEGGTHPRGRSSNVVTGIGIHDAAQIFYRANANYLTPSSDFADARQATIDAATDLFGAGSTQVTQTGNAWTAVGVVPPPSYVVIDTRTNLSGARLSTRNFSYATNGATAMRFVISGGSGDADLYVRFGSPPTTSAYDCRPYASGNNETCEFNPAQNGTYHVMIRGYAAYSGVTLTVSAAGASSPATETSCTDTTDNDGDGAVDCADSDCAADPACAPPPPPPTSFSYTASNTNSAQQNTVNQSIALTAGQTLTIGTCGVTGASFTGDTYLRLRNPSNVQVASNDDACGGLGSRIVYTATTNGNFQIRAGCYSSGSCSGTVAWTIQ